jgi:hypothetical protein
MKSTTTIFLFFLIILSCFAAAQTLPIRYWGDITIDGQNAPSETKIEVFIDGELTETTITPSKEGASAESYFVNILTQDKKEMTFKVWGIEAIKKIWNVAESGQFINLDLSVNKTPNEEACAYNRACQSGNCCSGICKESCPVQSTTTPTTTTTPTGGGGGGGGGSAPTSTTTTNTNTQPEPSTQTINPYAYFDNFGSDFEEETTENKDQSSSEEVHTDTQTNTENKHVEVESGMEKTTGRVIGETTEKSSVFGLLIVLGMLAGGSLLYFFKRK